MTLECMIPQSLMFKLKSFLLNHEEEKDYTCYENDIQPLYEYLYSKHLWFNQMNEDRQAAMIYMSFMGIKNFESFVNMIDAMKDSNYYLAHREILNSNYAIKFEKKALMIADVILKGSI
jgi:hypothetical protein